VRGSADGIFVVPPLRRELSEQLFMPDIDIETKNAVAELFLIIFAA
jgi:hypothetical protein